MTNFNQNENKNEKKKNKTKQNKTKQKKLTYIRQTDLNVDINTNTVCKI